MSSIDLATRICDYVRAVKDANDDRLNLLAEMSSLATLLYILRDRFLDAADKSEPGFIDMLVQAGIQKALNECHSALQSVALGSDGLDRLVNKLKWPFRRDEIQQTIGKIEILDISCTPSIPHVRFLHCLLKSASISFILSGDSWKQFETTSGLLAWM